MKIGSAQTSARALFSAVCGLSMLVTSPPGHASTSAPDWALVRIEAGSSWADVSLVVRGTAETTGSGPVLIGSGAAGPRETRFRFEDFAQDGETISTTRQVGGLHLVVTPFTNEQFYFYATPSIELLAPGQVGEGLVFFANASIISLVVTPKVYVGSPVITTTQGGGTTALHMATPGDDGAAAQATVAAAGGSLHRDQPTAGIVGAIDFRCSACAGSWSAPDGHAGLWATQGEEYPNGYSFRTVGSFKFAGPAGEWKWTWSGAKVSCCSATLYGAYVPIGRDWTYWRKPCFPDVQIDC